VVLDSSPVTVLPMPPLRRFARVEAALGLGVAALIAVGVLFSGVIFRFAYDDRQVTALSVLGFAALGLPLALPEVVSLAFLLGAYGRSAWPTPLLMAARQRAVRGPLGVALAAWWLTHFVVTIWIAEAAVRLAVIRHANVQEHALQYALQAGFMIGASFAGNLFLILAVRAVSRDLRFVRRVHAARYPIDLVILGALLLFNS
jgi:hypothetical protein